METNGQRPDPQGFGNRDRVPAALARTDRAEAREDRYELLARPKLALRAKAGAGSGNRTRIFSLEGCCSTIELYPHRVRPPRPCRPACPAEALEESEGWWRGLDSNQRTLSRPDLQSGAFNHSTTPPYAFDARQTSYRQIKRRCNTSSPSIRSGLQSQGRRCRRPRSTERGL